MNKFIVLLFAAVSAFCLGIDDAQAVFLTHVDDPFTDGARSDGADPFDVDWYKNKSSISASVVNDPVLSSSALFVNNPSGGISNAFLVFASFPTVSLGSNTGDRVTLSFDIRLNTIATSGSGFRFGLWNSASPPSSDDFISSGNGFAGVGGNGYRVQLSTGSTAGVGIERETGGADGITGGSGGQATVLLNIGSGAPFINDTTRPHSISLAFERLSTTNILIEFALDGVASLGADQLPGAVDAFNLMVFRGVANNLDYTLDNVRVFSTSSVPEPGTFGLVALAALVVLRRRHRSVSTNQR